MAIKRIDIPLDTIALLKDLLVGMGSLLFPARCAGCDRVDRPSLCNDCHSKLEWIDPDIGCSRCGEKLGVKFDAGRRVCKRCRENPPDFVQAVSALRYVNPLNRIVTIWKYHDQREISETLSDLLCEWIAGHAPDWWEKIEAAVPVPHHPRTLRSRGFSPSEDLAINVASRMGLPCMPRVLFKTRFTAPQAGLGGAARIENLRFSMKVFDRELVENRVLLVVDDVMTTGATLRECARALLEAGASKVYCLTLARQSGGKI